MVARQIGQLEWLLSHKSMQEAWNECLHALSCRTSSPSANTDRHTAHSPPISFVCTSFWYLMPASTVASSISRWDASDETEGSVAEASRRRRHPGGGGARGSRRRRWMCRLAPGWSQRRGARGGTRVGRDRRSSEGRRTAAVEERGGR